jgi:hypothetical protein
MKAIKMIPVIQALKLTALCVGGGIRKKIQPHTSFVSERL